ncbi:MAG TPA: hypothetical protein VMD09_01785 [Solirubrobacteraceae bacterium]|nr:hypothetical protein [Solirubrobacteraceae bacterium]
MFKSIKRLLVAAAAILALSAPSSAFAMVFATDGGGSAGGPAQPSSAPSVARAASSSQGFLWGDAGVGAASIIVLLGAGVGIASVTRQRRAHRPVAS